MKRFFALFLSLLFVLTLCACGGSGVAPEITQEQALEIALQTAGVNASEISGLQNVLDTEDGRLVYEIDFRVGLTEYSFDVNAKTGEIIDADRDITD